MTDNPSICAASFYGRDYKVNEKIARPFNSSQNIVPYRMKDLVNGPSVMWKVFKKQAEALDFISKYKHYLMGFVFESASTRLFLVAHPEVFWHYDSQRPPNCRCSYEIINENAACKLYFDLEYMVTFNPACNGPRMIQSFIAVVIFYLKEMFKVECELDHVINLDSTTEDKFSRHLIFNIPYVCFANNGQAGNFVNYVCSKILEIGETKLTPSGINITAENCLEMLVENAKHNKTLFCDLSVYSRNRHFRLYKSTKYGKFAPLLPSPESRVNTNDYDAEKEYFFGSLITYIPADAEKLRVLCFDNNTRCRQLLRKNDTTARSSILSTEISESPYKNIDNFINTLVSPGKIYRSFYFPSSKVINYDIVGNRFCGNIGRPHKSNNVKYVIDLKDGTYYQKCHDYECSFYKSEKHQLPKNLQLLDFVDSSSNLGMFDVSETAKHSLERFPSCGLSDEEIMNHFSNHPSQKLIFSDISGQMTNLPPNHSLQRFPSFDLNDEEIINHFSTENINI